MIEYKKQLKRVIEIYGDGNKSVKEGETYPWGEGLRKIHQLQDWSSVGKAESYLEKYWLVEKEYLEKWKPIQDKIFINQDSWFPEMMFENQYYLYPTIGGKVFWEKSIVAFNNCLSEIGESKFVVIQNTFNDTYTGLNDGLFFRLKYPVGIKWEELNIGHTLTDDLLIGADQDFFVFGENKGWAMYSATRNLWPMNILAFKQEYKEIFLKYFSPIKLQEENIVEFLPEIYLNRMPKY